MLIKEVMSSPAICVDLNTTIKQAIEIMEKERLGFLPVTKDDYLVGVITDRDLLIRGKNYRSDTKISKLMTKNVITVNLSSSLLDAGRLMSQNKIRRLVVVDNDLIKGVITSKDLLNEDYLIPYIKETYNISYY